MTIQNETETQYPEIDLEIWQAIQGDEMKEIRKARLLYFLKDVELSLSGTVSDSELEDYRIASRVVEKMSEEEVAETVKRIRNFYENLDEDIG